MAIPARITIVGATLWSTLLARGLQSRGSAVTFINTASGAGSGYATVAARALTMVGLNPERKTYPLATLGRMTVTEFDSLEQIVSSSRLTDAATQILIADRAALVEIVLQGAGVASHRARQIRHVQTSSGAISVQYGREATLETDLLILTGGPAAAAGQVVSSQAEPSTANLELVTEVGWADHGHDLAALRLLDGPMFAGGSASLMLCPGGTYLTMTNNLDAITDAHLETREIIDQLIAHPGMNGLLPATNPSYTANVVRPLSMPPHPVFLDQGVLDLSHLSGLIDPFVLEPDLAIGISTANTLGELLGKATVGVAAMSHVTRASIKAISTTHSVIDDLQAALPGWSERQADTLLMRTS